MQDKLRKLNPKNQALKEQLRLKINRFSKVLSAVYPFGKQSRGDSPKEYFAGLTIYKFSSFHISLENALLSNDVFLAIYLYRYVHELHIKVRYILTAENDDVTKNRLENFFLETQLKFPEYLKLSKQDLISQKLTESHERQYQMMSRFVHPNYASMKLHLERTDDQQFDFLAVNIGLTIWHMTEILRLYHSLTLLKINEKIRISEFDELQVGIQL